MNGGFFSRIFLEDEKVASLPLDFLPAFAGMTEQRPPTSFANF